MKDAEEAEHSNDVPLHKASTLDYSYDHTDAWSLAQQAAKSWTNDPSKPETKAQR